MTEIFARTQIKVPDSAGEDASSEASSLEAPKRPFDSVTQLAAHLPNSRTQSYHSNILFFRLGEQGEHVILSPELASHLPSDRVIYEDPVEKERLNKLAEVERRKTNRAALEIVGLTPDIARRLTDCHITPETIKNLTDESLTDLGFGARHRRRILKVLTELGS
ncbi:MAG: hypothetical protein HY430_02850 [Candidatus Levybacteria bacterium]|nr:hypothetical protein [Candidatus Levybacteria bacterium]